MAYSKLGQGFSLVNMIKKVWHFAKPYIIKYYVAFLCGGFSWMLLDVYVTKGIDASFVSAFMDSIMAGTAILAVLAARNYLAQFTAQEGYKLAIELINLNLLPMENNFISIIQRHNDVYKFLDANQKIVPTNYHLDTLFKHITALKKDSNGLTSIIADVDFYLKRINTYGLVVSNKKEFDFSRLMSNLSNLEKSYADLCEKLTAIHSSMKYTFNNNSKSKNKGVASVEYMYTYSSVIERIPEDKKIVDGYFEAIKESHENLFLNNRVATKFFITSPDA